MTNEQFERLKPYEQELKWAHRQNFLSMGNGRFGELMVIYKELYNSELNKSQRACGTCRLRAVKRIATDFFDHAQNLAIAEKEERLNEPTEEDKPKKKAGRPRKINLEG